MARRRGDWRPGGSNTESGLISVRIGWDLLTRLDAYSVKHKDGDRSATIREAIRDYLDKPYVPHGPLPDMDLARLVADTAHVPMSMARVYIGLGKVKVNGEVERRLEIPPGPVKIEVSD